MVDSAGRLVEHADQRQPGRPEPEPRTEERGGDAVEDEHPGAETAGAAEDRRCVERGQRKRPLGERDEVDRLRF